jgi:AcrR family transcriptional regulator
MCSGKATIDRRGAILAAAGKVFHAHGYAATTMEAVAAEAGVAKGSLYNYFRNKQDLFTQLFAEITAGDEADTEQLVAEDISADEKLWKLIDGVFTKLERYTAIGGLVLEFWATAARQKHHGELAEMFEQMFSRWRRQIGAIITQGIESGLFRAEIDPEAAASLILAMMDGIIVQSILDVGAKFSPPSLEGLKKGLVHGLSAWADLPSPKLRQAGTKDQLDRGEL